MSPYHEELRARVGHDLLILPGVGAVIRDEEGQILLQRRSDDDQWGLPGGAMDPGEPPALAVVREVWEETGLRVIPERLTGVCGGEPFRHTYPNGDVVDPVLVLFECRVVEGRVPGDGEPAGDSETKELRYFPPDALPPLVSPYPLEILASTPDRPFFQWNPEWLENLDPS